MFFLFYCCCCMVRFVVGFLGSVFYVFFIMFCVRFCFDLFWILVCEELIGVGCVLVVVGVVGFFLFCVLWLGCWRVCVFFFCMWCLGLVRWGLLLGFEDGGVVVGSDFLMVRCIFVEWKGSIRNELKIIYRLIFLGIDLWCLIYFWSNVDRSV